MLTIEKIAERICNSRKRLGYSQDQLVLLLEGQGVRISRETISKIENGARSVSALEIKAICEVLQINLDDFLREEKETDLVVLYRKYRKVESAEAENELRVLQDMIRDFSNQMKINRGEIKMREYQPLWKE